MLETTARAANCQRCANCSRQYCTGRLYPRLDQNQAEDGRDSEAHHQTTDHLATYRLTEQKCHEWRIKMWTATVDSTKAFDSISHKSIWNALKSCGIEHDYICFLNQRHLYRQTKRATFSTSGKEQSKVIRCPACSSTQFFNTH